LSPPGGQVALRDLHVADAVAQDRQIALPPGVAGVGFCSASWRCR
jgi:hypothetical protein